VLQKVLTITMLELLGSHHSLISRALDKHNAVPGPLSPYALVARVENKAGEEEEVIRETL
jgi:hypothetical protein